MKKLFFGIIAFSALSIISACGSSDTIVETKAGNITKDEFYEEMKKYVGDQIIEQLVEKKLLEDKYEVSKEEIEEELEKIKSNFDSDEDFELALTQNGYESVDQFKEDIRFNLLRQKAATDGIKVTDKKLEEYYNENKDKFVEVEARHILVEDEKKAKEVKEKLDNGAKFEDLVKEYSTDTVSAADGGKVGTVTADSQMVREFIEATLKLKEGEISEPVKTSFGYHIILADKRTEKTLKNNRKDIEKRYLQDHAKPYEEVREKLFKEAKIKVKDKQFKDLFKLDDDKDKDKDKKDDK